MTLTPMTTKTQSPPQMKGQLSRVRKQAKVQDATAGIFKCHLIGNIVWHFGNFGFDHILSIFLEYAFYMFGNLPRYNTVGICLR